MDVYGIMDMAKEMAVVWLPYQHLQCIKMLSFCLNTIAAEGSPLRRII